MILDARRRTKQPLATLHPRFISPLDSTGIHELRTANRKSQTASPTTTHRTLRPSLSPLQPSLRLSSPPSSPPSPLLNPPTPHPHPPPPKKKQRNPTLLHPHGLHRPRHPARTPAVMVLSPFRDLVRAQPACVVFVGEGCLFGACFSCMLAPAPSVLALLLLPAWHSGVSAGKEVDGRKDVWMDGCANKTLTFVVCVLGMDNG